MAVCFNEYAAVFSLMTHSKARYSSLLYFFYIVGLQLESILHVNCPSKTGFDRTAYFPIRVKWKMVEMNEQTRYPVGYCQYSFACEMDHLGAEYDRVKYLLQSKGYV